MYRSTNRSNRFALMTSVALAVALMLGLVAVSPAFAAASKPDCRQGGSVEFALHFENGSALAPNCLSRAIPVTGAAGQPQVVEEGSHLQLDLMWGQGNTHSALASPAQPQQSLSSSYVGDLLRRSKHDIARK